MKQVGSNKQNIILQVLIEQCALNKKALAAGVVHILTDMKFWKVDINILFRDCYNLFWF